MAIVEVEINSKIYQIGCEKEDESKLRECIKVLNERIDKFKKQDPVLFMGLNDEKIFLFEAITLIAENFEKAKQAPNLQQKDAKDVQEPKKNINVPSNANKDFINAYSNLYTDLTSNTLVVENKAINEAKNEGKNPTDQVKGFKFSEQLLGKESHETIKNSAKELELFSEERESMLLHSIDVIGNKVAKITKSIKKIQTIIKL